MATKKAVKFERLKTRVSGRPRKNHGDRIGTVRVQVILDRGSDGRNMTRSLSVERTKVSTVYLQSRKGW
jgi:hypothetical protein